MYNTYIKITWQLKLNYWFRWVIHGNLNQDVNIARFYGYAKINHDLAREAFLGYVENRREETIRFMLLRYDPRCLIMNPYLYYSKK